MQQFKPIESVFKGRHFDGETIILCVRWYTSFKLSLRDLVIMMAERGVSDSRNESRMRAEKKSSYTGATPRRGKRCEGW